MCYLMLSSTEHENSCRFGFQVPHLALQKSCQVKYLGEPSYLVVPPWPFLYNTSIAGSDGLVFNFIKRLLYAGASIEVSRRSGRVSVVAQVAKGENSTVSISMQPTDRFHFSSLLERSRDMRFRAFCLCASPPDV